MSNDEISQVLAVMVTSWPQRELSRPEHDLWSADLVSRSFEDAMTAVMACRKRLDWFPSAHQFEVEYQDALGRRLEAERQAQRELLEASAAPADSAVVRHHLTEIRQKLAGARGPLAANLRAEFDR